MYDIYGLTDNDVQASRAKYGRNEIIKPSGKSFIKRYIENLFDPIIKILIVALIINIVFMLGNFDIIESIGIAMTIVISTLVSTISEIGSEKAFDNLNKEFYSSKIKVFREGNLINIDPVDLVVGDFLLVNSGDKISADGIIVQGEISVDESALTGETKEIKKVHGFGESLNFTNPSAIFCGSLVTCGSCVMKVVAIADKTYYGSAAISLVDETPTSPLREKLTKLAKKISSIGYLGATVVALFYLFNTLIIKNNFDYLLIIEKVKDIKYIISLLINSLTTAITIIVVAVPEGLPMMITVILSSNMKKMLKDNVLVKKMVGIETAGSMNLLFCDKTGTITTGKQTVGVFILGNGASVSINSLKHNYRRVFDLMHMNAVYNCESVVTTKGVIGGNATDKAISQAFAGYKFKYASQVLEKIPFNSTQKYSAVKVKNTETHVIYKGAPDKLLAHCTSYIGEEGKLHKLDIDAISKNIVKFENESKRLCLVAIASDMPLNNKIPALTLLGIVSITDPIRLSAKSAVMEIQGAGVQIVMITGDAPNTALAIAKSVNICNDQQNIVITGNELSKLSDLDIKKILPRLAVISRALPGDKRRLVRIAQETGLVTGMTGDGINDSPALKLADIGFAMGSGTDVAKEAGDILILDNNIKSIGKCMLYGRTIFESIKKFIVFQLTMNLCAVSITILGPFLGVDTPITMIQMLWINIIMDTIGALAFACETPLADTMKQKPKKRDDPIVTPLMISKIVYNGVFSVLLCLVYIKTRIFLDYFDYYNNIVKFLSGLFCLFVFEGIVNAYTSRSIRLNILNGLDKNKFFVIIMSLVACVQLLMLFAGNQIFRTTPLNINEILIIVIMSLLIVPADLIRKLITKRVNRNYI